VPWERYNNYVPLFLLCSVMIILVSKGEKRGPYISVTFCHLGSIHELFLILEFYLLTWSHWITNITSEATSFSNHLWFMLGFVLYIYLSFFKLLIPQNLFKSGYLLGDTRCSAFTSDDCPCKRIFEFAQYGCPMSYRHSVISSWQWWLLKTSGLVWLFGLKVA